MRAKIWYENSVISCPPFCATDIDESVKTLFTRIADKYSVKLGTGGKNEIVIDLPEGPLYGFLCHVGNKFAELNETFKKHTPPLNTNRAAGGMIIDWTDPAEILCVAEIYIKQHYKPANTVKSNSPQQIPE